MLKTICIALALLCSAAAGAQNHPERGLVRKGNRQFDKGEYLQSVRRYEQALEAAPGNFEATYDLGGALYRTEAYDKAAQSFAAAAADTLRTDEERAEAFYNLGNARFKQEQYREALESYKQSLRLNPADQEAKYNYAYTKRLLDQQQDQQQHPGMYNARHGRPAAVVDIGHRAGDGSGGGNAAEQRRHLVAEIHPDPLFLFFVYPLFIVLVRARK